ncbi:hypothetical protein CC851_24795 [Salmonella enterica subsp. enterica serovar Kasenyi]|nr:hypothetical protein [Salmonella enterica subsp. enterica serovar Kasenyi]
MVCCWFWLTAAPFAAKLSGAVRATDVMVNMISFCRVCPANYLISYCGRPFQPSTWLTVL